MFAAETKVLVKKTGAKEDLISNCNLNKKMDVLTLVRVKSGIVFQYPKYSPFHITLPELVGDKDFTPEVEEEVLVGDFKNWVETNVSSKLGAAHDIVGEAEVSGDYDSTDGLTEAVSIKKKKVNLSAVRNAFGGRRVDEGKMKALRLKEDRLAIVYETVYNTGPVTIVSKGTKSGGIAGSFHKIANLAFKACLKNDTTFTVQENSTFAFSLVELLLEDGVLEIPYESWTHKRRGLTHDAVNREMINEVREGIEMKEGLLMPLEGVPDSTRSDLLKGLQKVLEEGNALSILEDTLDLSSKGENQRPQSQVVSSFMDLLDKSNVSSKVKDALHVLVAAMEGLPEITLRLLISCDPDTMTVLTQLVESLRDKGKACLPASPPASLQQDGELRWAADLLCCSEETLTELSESWGQPPEVLLEVLALTVLGVHKLQPRK